MRYFIANSKNYTTKHNNIMDSILWGLCRGEDPLLWYSAIKEAYSPYDDTGDCHDEAIKILEYLVELDLIEEVIE